METFSFSAFSQEEKDWCVIPAKAGIYLIIFWMPAQGRHDTLSLSLWERVV